MNEKQKLYDAVCKVLTDYKTQKAVGDDLYWILTQVKNNWETISLTSTKNNTNIKGEISMSLINELQEKSNNADMVKQEVITEIIKYFDEYLYSEELEKYLRSRIGDREIKERKVFMMVNFWKYHEGCSSTYFHCGGKSWKNPENPESYKSDEYKGVNLNSIHTEICVCIKEKLTERMKELGFRLVSKEKKTSRLGYYEVHMYFGW